MKNLKKIFLLILILFLGCSCNSKEDEKLSKERTIYQNYIKKLQKVKESSDEDYPFDIEVKFDKLTKNEIRYQVVIDNPKEKITDISAIVYHNKQTDDIFPSTGIFEKEESLTPGKKPSGLILVGYIPYSKSLESFKCTLKVLIRYSENKKTKTVYYVTKKS